MSAFHFDRRQLRRSAWATLLVWALALAAGVVNACALSSVAIEPDHAHAETVGHHEHGQDFGKGSCLKSCDDESSAIAQLKLPAVNLSATLLTVAQPWNAVVAAGGVGFRPSLECAGSQGPPLVIRLLRLTL